MLRKDNVKTWTVILVMGGFALVNNNVVTILVNEAESALVRFIFCQDTYKKLNNLIAYI